MIEIGVRHWSLALGAALIAHASMLALVQDTTSSGLMSAGFGGIEVSLEPAGSASGSLPASRAKPLEIERVVPDEILSSTPPEVTTASVSQSRQTTGNGPVEPVRVVRAVSVESTSAMPVLTPQKSKTVAPDEVLARPSTDVAATISGMAEQLTTVLADPPRAVRTKSVEIAPAVLLRPPAEIEVMLTDELLSELPTKLVVANWPETTQLTGVSAEPAQTVFAAAALPVRPESIEIARAVMIARQVQPVTAGPRVEATDAIPEKQTVINEVLPAKEVTTQPSIEPVHAKPFEEITARLVVTPPAPTPKPKPSRRMEVTRVQTKPASTLIPAKTPLPQPGLVEAKTDRLVTAQITPLMPTATGAEDGIGTERRANADNGGDTPGGGPPGEVADYYTRLIVWLKKHKRYPRLAKLHNEQGVVLLRFMVTRAGEVRSFGIKKSSGHSRLDEEVKKMIQRAQPLPKIPPEIREDRVELLVPVEFILQ